MTFKDISYLWLCGPFVQRSGTILATLVEGIIRKHSVIFFLIGPVVQEMLFKDISYLELWSGVEWSGVEWSGVEWSGVEWSGIIFAILVILLNDFEFGPVVQEMSFNDASYIEHWQPFCSTEQHHLCIFGREIL